VGTLNISYGSDTVVEAGTAVVEDSAGIEAPVRSINSNGYGLLSDGLEEGVLV